MVRSATPHPWNLYELLHAAGVECQAQSPGAPPRIRALAVDSRAVAPGTCFIAIPGVRNDGHQFVDQAVAAGAAAVIVEAGRYDGNCPVAVRVPDTRLALARLAATFHGVDALQRSGALTLVGVTGTNGKTTTCAILASMLEAAGAKALTLGTITNCAHVAGDNGSLTTLPPLELCELLAAEASRGVTHVAMEASSHALDQRRCGGLKFAVGVFTNLTQDHLDYHVTMEAYARAKRRLFEGLGPGAAAVINADDAWSDSLVEGCAARVVRYGLEQPGDVAAEEIELGLGRTRFTLRLGRRDVAVETRLIGRHNVRNILAAAAAAEALGISPSVIQRGIAALSAVRGRLQRVEASVPFSVFVDYAHTPDALRNVLGLLREVSRGRLICVFGCGGDRDRTKRPVMARAVAELADVAVVTSDNPRREDPEAIVDETLAGFAPGDDCRVIREVDRRLAIGEAVALARPGDVVLIAGKGHEDYQIIGAHKRWFDDAVVAREALATVREVA